MPVGQDGANDIPICFMVIIGYDLQFKKVFSEQCILQTVPLRFKRVIGHKTIGNSRCH